MNTTNDLDAKYLAQAVPLLDEIAAGIKKATGLEGVRSEYLGTFSFNISDLHVQIMVDHERVGYSVYSKKNTGDPLIRVYIGGCKARFHKRADGTYNIQKIVDDVVQAAANQRTSKEAFEKSEILRKENQRLMTAELGAIEVPKGVRIHRDPMNGIYLIMTSGGGRFPDLTISEATEVLALLKKYRFEGRGF
jgi:hypothetical protein